MMGVGVEVGVEVEVDKKKKHLPCSDIDDALNFEHLDLLSMIFNVFKRTKNGSVMPSQVLHTLSPNTESWWHWREQRRAHFDG
jgi:hypothetical protein